MNYFILQMYNYFTIIISSILFLFCIISFQMYKNNLIAISIITSIVFQ